MSTGLPGAATLSEGVTTIVAKAGEAAGNSLLDEAFAWVEGNPSAAGIMVGIGIGVVVARIALPVLQRLASKTTTKIDDRAVAVFRWLVGAVADRVDQGED